MLKFALAASRGRLDFKYLYASGGMPSVHSAVVCSLATTALLVDGINSPIFGFAALFAAIVMYDSFGVRRASGEQAAALNLLFTSLGRDRIKLSGPSPHLREILGHKPLEVTVGAILGILLALLFNISRLSTQLTWLSTVPGRLEFKIYLILFAVLVVAGIISRLWLGRRFKGYASIQKFNRSFMLMTQVIGWLGLLASFGQYERIGGLSWRVWPLALLVSLLIWMFWLLEHYWKSLPAELAEERDQARKRKWFPRKKRR